MSQVRITIIEQKGSSALVEWTWNNTLQRAFIPVQEIHDGERVDTAVLDAGIPYGEAWQELPVGRIGAERVADALRRHGIWTKADARNVGRVRAALAEAYARDLEIVLNATRG